MTTSGLFARGQNDADWEKASPKSSSQRRLSLEEADSVLASLWDQDVDAWDRYWVPVFTLFARDLIADAAPSAGDVVLDVGTGSGVAAIETCKAAPSVGLAVGIDRSSAMIRLACKKAGRARLRNVRFYEMAAEDLRFPDGFFEVAISNCGIAVTNFTKGMREVLRVLKPGGVLVFNDWHLIDVKPHRIFGDVLRKYRTATPSPLLAQERSALATMESYHHSLNPRVQQKIVSEAGFRGTKLTNRRYRVRLTSLDEYLKMRTSRATIQREISEMPPERRASFLSELRERLREFLVSRNFAFDWNVFYISAKKPW